MSDLVDRLLSRAYAFKAPDPLLEEAAAEIARLRITDAEREAIEYVVRHGRSQPGSTDTLRGLLERLE